MELIDNINSLLGESLKDTLKPGAKLKIAASCFSIYAYVALKRELESIDSLEFIFTSPTFVPNEATDKLKKEQREFHIPKAERERSLTGSEFEIQLKNKLTQKAIARECADWIRRKATFRSNRGQAPMQPFIGVRAPSSESVYMPVQGFTAVDLGYQKGNALSNIVTRFDEPAHTGMFLNLFEQIWNDQEKLEDVTARLCDHIASVYQENAPERIYFLMLYNIFREFLEDVSEDVLPNDRTGYQDTVIWNKLFNFQRDAATGLINKLETYSGCILADSVGLGKTFTALAVIKYYELRNKSVLVLCPKKLADNWLTYNQNLKTNILAKDHSSDIFTADKPKDDFSNAFEAKRHIYDYVFTDSTNERKFVEQLDASTEVVVYAKLPKSFFIPTPVGNYNPDWAIAFQEGKVKHIYFIAETKGSMSTLDLRAIEASKIACARKFFAKITSEQVRYDVVDGYGKLMELVK